MSSFEVSLPSAAKLPRLRAARTRRPLWSTSCLHVRADLLGIQGLHAKLDVVMAGWHVNAVACCGPPWRDPDASCRFASWEMQGGMFEEGRVDNAGVVDSAVDTMDVAAVAEPGRSPREVALKGGRSMAGGGCAASDVAVAVAAMDAELTFAGQCQRSRTSGLECVDAVEQEVFVRTVPTLEHLLYAASGARAGHAAIFPHGRKAEAEAPCEDSVPPVDLQEVDEELDSPASFVAEWLLRPMAERVRMQPFARGSWRFSTGRTQSASCAGSQQREASATFARRPGLFRTWMMRGDNVGGCC